MADVAIELDHVAKTFAKTTFALRDVSFSVAQGVGLCAAWPQRRRQDDDDQHPVHAAAADLRPGSRRGITTSSASPHGYAQASESPGNTPRSTELLTGRENLVLFGRLRGLRRSHARLRADELIEQFDMAHAADRRVSTYSGGMRRRIDIAAALVVPPKVLFLDEPTTGLDPRSRRDVWDLVSSLSAQDVTVLLTTQYLEEADVLSDSIVIIDAGQIIASGTADDLKRRVGFSYCEVTPGQPGGPAPDRRACSPISRAPKPIDADEHRVGARARWRRDAR